MIRQPLIGASLPPQPSEDDCSRGVFRSYPLNGDELMECVKKIYREAMNEKIDLTPPSIESEEA